MPFNLYYFSYLLLIPGVIFAFWAQINVSASFRRGSRVPTGLSGAEAARRILDSNGLSQVRIERVAGDLTDHYDPRANVIRLSDSVYDKRSAAAVGVAAHEAGHAVQYAQGYAPIKLRSAIIPVCNIGSNMAMPLFVIGLLVSSMSEGSLGYGFMMAGIFAFSAAVLFQAVTLPVEFDASRRALKALSASGEMEMEELGVARRVLKAAALTYVAALASSLLSLLRLIIIASGSRGRRR